MVKTIQRLTSWKIFPVSLLLLLPMQQRVNVGLTPKNKQADKQLKTYLDSQFSCVKRITGYSPSTGHAEPGWLVNCSFAQGCDIGLSFKQDAIYWSEAGQLFVSYCGVQRSKVHLFDIGHCQSVSEWGDGIK